MFKTVIFRHLCHHQAMMENRSLLAETRAQGGSVDGEAVRDALANVKCKRMPIRCNDNSERSTNNSLVLHFIG